MGTECGSSWMIPFWMLWLSIIIQIAAFSMEIAWQSFQLNGNILPLSDVIAFTHVKKLKCVHHRNRFQLLLCMLVCFFSLPAVFSFFKNSFRKNQNNIGCRWKKRQTEKRKDFNGKAVKMRNREKGTRSPFVILEE